VETFKSLDMFGHPIGVNFKGSEVYRTKLGALVSLIAYTIIGTYAVIKTLRLVSRDNPEKQSLIEVLNTSDPEN